ncbi:oligosaccharide flippase family protein [Nibribacter ruber]|uniref:Oligosaccharide flippase family protein n=1 Tax=Nibribacter ruber TaxID=2698458 RepID=A0A6P1NZV9_9BACT|nr:flippase [Nibribacter ruber]QHL86553.1 oligosaccharide flippase family protein [Nibribacter ruber]
MKRFLPVRVQGLLLNQTRKRLIQNFLSLSVLQGLNYLLPLLVMPVLMQALGVATFGLLSYAQAFIQYFIIVIDYGFDLSGTQQIARHREEPAQLRTIVTHILALKLIFFIGSFLVLWGLVTWVPVFMENRQLFLVAFGVALGQLFMPVWFFQGMERMKYVTIVHLISKAIYASLILLLVRQPEDILWVPVLQALGILVAGGVSLGLLWKEFGIRPTAVTWQGLRYQLGQGWFVFVSNVSISAYTISNTFFLGLLAGPVAAGYYSGAEKIVRAVQGLFIPVSQTLFPYLSKLMHTSKERMVEVLRQLTRWTFLGAACASVAIAVMAPLLVRWVMGEEFLPVVPVLRLMAGLPLLVCLSNVFGIQAMLNLGYRKQFFFILCTGSLLNICSVPFVAGRFEYTGVAILLMATEGLVTLLMFAYLYKKGIKLI